MNSKQSFYNLNFINSAINKLPIQTPTTTNPQTVRGYFYSKVEPKIRPNPKIIILSDPALNLLDLTKEEILKDQNSFTQFFCGNLLNESQVPIAHCYCGHQFGSWAGQLGDGRAISIGDIRNKKGQIIELQLKGSGVTPYSRFADGNAVLRSSIREFLCSEFLYFLDIPTTRAASIVQTDDLAQRDIYYNGNVIQEKCCIVLRLAPTFIRFGSFQICDKGGPSEGLGDQMIPELTDYVIDLFYEGLKDKEDKYRLFFEDIVKKTAILVAKWQTVAFCHGVLNTDNMSILGLTIDFGPFGFMEHFNKEHICNHSDQDGYYSYENQPKACKWNLLRLAESLKYVLDFGESKKYIEENFDVILQENYYNIMREKLGIYSQNQEDCKRIVDQLIEVMHELGLEYTNFFRKLSTVNILNTDIEDILNQFLLFKAPDNILMDRIKPRFTQEMLEKISELYESNPLVMQMRGFTIDIIEREQQKIIKYNQYIENQKDIQKQHSDILYKWIESYKEILKNEKIDFQERAEKMKKINPSFVLRNYMLQQCIENVDKGNFQQLEELMAAIQKPFEDIQWKNIQVNEKTPQWAFKLCVSCSS